MSPQRQRSLRESQGALLEKVEELNEQLVQERQRVQELEGQLITSNLSLQTMDKVLLHLHNQVMLNSFFRFVDLLFSFSCKEGSHIWKERGI